MIALVFFFIPVLIAGEPGKPTGEPKLAPGLSRRAPFEKEVGTF